MTASGGACPSCGTPRAGSERRCAECGFDFWRAAAGDATPVREASDASPASPGSPTASSARQSSGPSVTTLIYGAIGLALVVAAVFVAPRVVGLFSRATPATQPVSVAPLSEEDRIVAAFFREARSPDAQFVVESESTLRIEGLEEPITATSTADGRIRGADHAFSLHIESSSADAVDGEELQVDGVQYARVGDGEWARQRSRMVEQDPINPFARIASVGEIDYLDRDARIDPPLHRLKVTKWLGGSNVAAYLSGVETSDRQSSLVIWVTDDGVPVRAELASSAVLSDARDRATVVTEATYRFSDWGDVEPIEAPE